MAISNGSKYLTNPSVIPVDSDSGDGSSIQDSLNSRAIQFEALLPPASGEYDPDNYLMTASGVKEGAYCKTTSYHAPSEYAVYPSSTPYFGGNIYQITSGTEPADGGAFIDLDSGLQAVALFPEGGISVDQFGALPISSFDSLSAFQAAMASTPAFVGQTINLSAGDYFLDGGLVINRPVKMSGKGVGIVGTGVTPATRILVPGDTDGITIDAGGNNASLNDFSLKAVSNSIGWAEGIVFLRRALLRRVRVENFSGHGISIDTSSYSLATNCNLFRLEYCDSIKNGGHGLFIRGADSNAGTNIGFNAVENGGFAIMDEGFLGNHHYGCHQSGGQGAYASTSRNSQGTFIGCYSENRDWSVVSNLVIGGSGSRNASNGPPTDSVKFYTDPNPTRVMQADLVSLGSGYTSAPTVTFDPPVGGETAEASSVIVKDGKIKFIEVPSLGAGAGYGSAPTVTITDSTGTGATASAIMGGPYYNNDAFVGKVIFVKVDNPGSGYSSTPTVTFSAPVQTTATGNASLLADGRVISINVTNQGSGYTSVPAITLSGGGGSGASFTAKLSRKARTEIRALSNIDNIFSFSRQGSELHFRYSDDGTGDVKYEGTSSSSDTAMLITGAKTAINFGRQGVQRYKTAFPNGVVITSRHVQMSSSIPPSSGDFARGDIIYAINPSAGGVPGVVCTTGGIAGSTAVFQNMAILSA